MGNNCGKLWRMPSSDTASPGRPDQAASTDPASQLTRLRIGRGFSRLIGEWRRLGAREHLGADSLAGFSVAADGLPLSLAIALASGVSPSLGLVSAILAGLVAAFFGGTALAITGPAVALVVLVATVVEQHGMSGLLVVGLGCGVLQIGLGLTGLGRLLQLVPQPVVASFSSGIAVCVLIGQMPRALGLRPPDQSHVLYVLSHIREEIAGTDLVSLALALATLVACFLLPRRLPRVPVPFLLVLLPALVLYVLPQSIATVGDIPRTLPSPRLPILSLEAIRSLLASTLMVFALASLEVRHATAALGKLTGTARAKLDQDLVGQGLANLLVTLFGAIPVTMVSARSALNVRAGARTRRAAMIQSLALVLMVAVLAPIIAQVPLASLAGILLWVAAKKVRPGELAELWRRSPSDGVIYVITFLAIVLGDLIAGVQVGLIAGFLIAAVRLGQLEVTLRRSGGDHSRLSLEGPLTFLSTRSLDPLRRSLAGDAPPSELVIDLGGVTTLDVAGAEMLAELVDQLDRRGTRVALVGLRPALEPILRGSDPDGHVVAHLARSEGEVHRLLAPGGEVARPMDRLVRGVERFRADKGRYAELFANLAEGQAPHTLFITCADSRLVPNLITSTDPGELFVVRNVGNIIPPFAADDLPAEGAAIEYAVAVLGVKEIVVCGHSGCGAMKALVSDKPIELPSLAQWLAHARSVRALGEHPTADDAARFNALRQLEHISTYPVVREKVASGEVRLHAWFFDIGASQLFGWDDEQEAFVALTGERSQALLTGAH